METKTLPVHQVGHEERCEQENERDRLGKWRENTEERRKGRRDKKRERKEGHTQRERSCKFRDQRAIKRLQLHGE